MTYKFGGLERGLPPRDEKPLSDRDLVFALR